MDTGRLTRRTTRRASNSTRHWGEQQHRKYAKFRRGRQNVSSVWRVRALPQRVNRWRRRCSPLANTSRTREAALSSSLRLNRSETEKRSLTIPPSDAIRAEWMIAPDAANALVTACSTPGSSGPVTVHTVSHGRAWLSNVTSSAGRGAARCIGVRIRSSNARPRSAALGRGTDRTMKLSNTAPSGHVARSALTMSSC